MNVRTKLFYIIDKYDLKNINIIAYNTNTLNRHTIITYSFTSNIFDIIQQIIQFI